MRNLAFALASSGPTHKAARVRAITDRHSRYCAHLHGAGLRLEPLFCRVKGLPNNEGAVGPTMSIQLGNRASLPVRTPPLAVDRLTSVRIVIRRWAARQDIREPGALAIGSALDFIASLTHVPMSTRASINANSGSGLESTQKGVPAPITDAGAEVTGSVRAVFGATKAKAINMKLR